MTYDRPSLSDDWIIDSWEYELRYTPNAVHMVCTLFEYGTSRRQTSNFTSNIIYIYIYVFILKSNPIDWQLNREMACHTWNYDPFRVDMDDRKHFIIWRKL